MQRCQPLILTFQFFKIFEQRTTSPPPPQSLNPDSIPINKVDQQVFNSLYIKGLLLGSINKYP